MKALVKSKAEQGIWMEDVEVPSCGYNDVLIKINKTAICGTDIHIYNWDKWAQQTISVPMVIGHEFSGEIAALGEGVSAYRIGERVSGEGHITCGFCRNCRAGKRHLCRNTQGVGVERAGAFAEYLVIPAANIFVLPTGITDDIAAILDPFGNATHTTLAFNLVGEDVLITGAGPIGIMAVAVAKHVGARHVVITDINDSRLALAKQMGATCAVNVEKQSIADVMQQLEMKEGFDIGLEMSGNAVALNDLIGHMNHGGQVALLGIPPEKVAIDWNQVIFKGLTLQGIYGRRMFGTWYRMGSMLQSGLNIAPVITHHFDADDYQKAFATMASGESGKVILNWQSH